MDVKSITALSAVARESANMAGFEVVVKTVGVLLYVNMVVKGIIVKTVEVQVFVIMAIGGVFVRSVAE